MAAIIANQKTGDVEGQTLQDALRDFPAEFADAWKRLPNKGLFFTLLAAWLALFHFLGNSTFGYIDTPSLPGWMYLAYSMPQSDDAHGLLMPLVVLVLLYLKRKELLAVRLQVWWPGLLIFVVALLLHMVGYLVQQPRVSIVAMFTGIYGLMGLAWGWQFLRASFFPFFLCGFCVPMGSLAESLSVPLRELAAKIVTSICSTVLGIDVIREGNQIFSPDRTYQYEVAAACSGIRSLIAIFAVATIYAFLAFRNGWKRVVLIASAAPLAVAGNVFRLMTIVISADVLGQNAGNYVHDGGPFGILSLLPYVPAIGGLMLIGHWLREPQPARTTTTAELTK